MNGCGATYCRFNTVGKCSLDFIILGERGECLLNAPSAERIQEQNRLQQMVAAESTEEVSTPNIIGFRED
jgi:hypothetical protein